MFLSVLSLFTCCLLHVISSSSAYSCGWRPQLNSFPYCKCPHGAQAVRTPSSPRVLVGLCPPTIINMSLSIRLSPSSLGISLTSSDRTSMPYQLRNHRRATNAKPTISSGAAHKTANDSSSTLKASDSSTATREGSLGRDEHEAARAALSKAHRLTAIREI
jgi:hypothetical protein